VDGQATEAGITEKRVVEPLPESLIAHVPGAVNAYGNTVIVAFNDKRDSFRTVSGLSSKDLLESYEGQQYET
jgi:hypothetical protein